MAGSSQSLKASLPARLFPAFHLSARFSSSRELSLKCLAIHRGALSGFRSGPPSPIPLSVAVGYFCMISALENRRGGERKTAEQDRVSLAERRQVPLLAAGASGGVVGLSLSVLLPLFSIYSRLNISALPAASSQTLQIFIARRTLAYSPYLYDLPYSLRTFSPRFRFPVRGALVGR